MSDKDSKTIADSMEETKERHLRYLRALNSPVRREIIRAIKDGNNTIESIQTRIKIDTKTLRWHLQILEWGFCVEKETICDTVRYRITQEGQVVDYTDK